MRVGIIYVTKPFKTFLQTGHTLFDVEGLGGTEQVIVDYHTDTPQTVQKKLADLD